MCETETQLLNAIKAFPDDDTPRLAYADFLDEKDTKYRRCPGCFGMKTEKVAVAYTDKPFNLSDYKKRTCRICDGLGEVPDTANTRDRAEFIRVEVELHQLVQSFNKPDTPQLLEGVKRRQEILRKCEADWKDWTCPRCNGSGLTLGDELFNCTGCFGMCNPLSKGNRVSSEPGYIQRIRREAGFYGNNPCAEVQIPDSINYNDLRPSIPYRVMFTKRGFFDAINCTMEEAGEILVRSGKREFVPTQWAHTIVNAPPDRFMITRFLITNREPVKAEWGEYWGWSVIDAILKRNDLSDVVWESLTGHVEIYDPVFWKWYPSVHDANDALARAIGKLVIEGTPL